MCILSSSLISMYDTAPSAPLTPRAFPINATSINVSWAPPLDNGGRDVRYYVVEIRVLGGGGSFALVGQVPGLQYDIIAVQDGTTYE